MGPCRSFRRPVQRGCCDLIIIFWHPWHYTILIHNLRMGKNWKLWFCYLSPLPIFWTPGHRTHTTAYYCIFIVHVTLKLDCHFAFYPDCTYSKWRLCSLSMHQIKRPSVTIFLQERNHKRWVIVCNSTKYGQFGNFNAFCWICILF